MQCTPIRIVTMGQHQVGERLASLLLYIKDEFGTQPDGALNIYMKRAEMANFIGTATESMIRTLKRFERNGWVRTHKKAIYLSNEQALHPLVEGILQIMHLCKSFFFSVSLGG